MLSVYHKNDEDMKILQNPNLTNQFKYQRTNSKGI